MHYLGVASPTTKVELGIHLPLRNRQALVAFVHQRPMGSSLKQAARRKWLSPAQFNAMYAPLPSDVAKAEASLKSMGFSIAKVTPQLITATGSAAAVNSAFATHVVLYKDVHGLHAGTNSKLTLPASLAALKANVVGVGAYVPVHPMFMLAKTQPAPHGSLTNQIRGFTKGRELNRYSPYGDYWFTDLKQAYSASSYQQLNGAGFTVATVGYSDFSDADAYQYWAYEGLINGTFGLAPPPVTEHDVYPGSEAFGNGDGTDVEADLDVQMAGGAAPGATIVGVAADATGSFGFLSAYADIAAYDFADVVTTSYGGCELYYTAPYNEGFDFTYLLAAYDDVFLQMASQGISVMFSSGDEAGLGCENVAGTAIIPGVDFWADDPNVTAVGGTNLETSYSSTSLASTRVSEQEIGDYWGSDPEFGGLPGGYWGSGGGVSTIWPQSSDQHSIVSLSGRGVPDFSMHMGGCPDGAELCAYQYGSIGYPDFYDSADIAVYEGNLVGLIGTSASSPEFAGTVATWDSGLGGRLGLMNPYLYMAAASSGTYYNSGIPWFNGITGGVSTPHSWNQSIGLGSLILNQFYDGGTTVSGNPQTASNP